MLEPPSIGISVLARLPQPPGAFLLGNPIAGRPSAARHAARHEREEFWEGRSGSPGIPPVWRHAEWAGSARVGSVTQTPVPGETHLFHFWVHLNRFTVSPASAQLLALANWKKWRNRHRWLLRHARF
jgi:hypothetical protein